MGTNHVNAADDPKQSSGAFVFDRPADATAPWPARIVSDGIVSRPSMGAAVLGAPGVFGWGDVDGDGDTDLVVAGDGDARIFWLEQTTPAAFVTTSSISRSARRRVLASSISTGTRRTRSCSPATRTASWPSTEETNALR